MDLSPYRITPRHAPRPVATRLVVATLLAACLALTSAGCFGGGEQTVAPPPALIDIEEADKLGLALRWRNDLDTRPGQAITHAVVSEGMLLIVEEPLNLITAIDARDGSLLWREVVGEVSETLYEPVVASDVIIVNSESRMYVLDPETGEAEGRVVLLESVISASRVVDDLAIFGSLTGRVVAIHIPTGITAWRYNMSAPIKSRPAVSLDDVFVADSDGVYAMLEADSGRLLWQGQVFDSVSGQPTADDRWGVLLPSEDFKLYALDRTIGRERWTYIAQRPIRESPRIVGDYAFLREGRRRVIAFDLADGEVLYEMPADAMPVAQVDNRMLVALPRELRLLAAETGQLLRAASSVPLQTVLEGPDQSIILITSEGLVSSWGFRR